MNAETAAVQESALTPEEINDARLLVWPEPLPIRSELRPVEPLPIKLIPDPLRPWLTDISDRMGCPLDYVVVATLVMLGSVIGAGCAIRPKRHDDWSVTPNLWGGVIGRPSIMMKSPALMEATRPLEQLAKESAKHYEFAKREFEADSEMHKARKKSVKDKMEKAATGKMPADSSALAKVEFMALEEPPEPVWRRYKTNDATVEKLGELLSSNPRGLLVYRDELIGLLSQWDREGREGERAFFLEAWNGTGSHETDRIGRGSIRIEHACVSILGGIQPAKLSEYLYDAMRGKGNDGLVQRFQLLVYPDEPPVREIVDRKPDIDAKNRVLETVRRIADMDFIRCGAVSPDHDGIPFFRFDEPAQQVFYAWFDQLSRQLSADEEPILIEHLGKFRKLMPSLALIFHVLGIADGSAPAGPIPESAATRAAAFCEYLESHARRIYGLIADIQIETAARLAKKIAKGELGTSFSLRELQRKGWSMLTDRDAVEAACEELVDRDWIRAEVPGDAPVVRFGRPPSTKYVINPHVLTSVSSVGALPPRFQEEQ